MHTSLGSALRQARLRAVHGWMLINHLTDPTVNGFQIEATVITLFPPPRLRANRAAAATRAPPRGGAGSRRQSPIPPPSRPVVAGAASEQWAGLLYKDGQMSTILNYSRRRILPRVRLEVSIRLLSLLLERELDHNILAHTRPHPPRSAFGANCTHHSPPN